MSLLKGTPTLVLRDAPSSLVLIGSLEDELTMPWGTSCYRRGGGPESESDVQAHPYGHSSLAHNYPSTDCSKGLCRTSSIIMEGR